MMRIIRHIAKAVLAAGYGGAIPAWAADKPTLAICAGVVGLAAHIVAYWPSSTR